jgi:hypothetical protein
LEEIVMNGRSDQLEESMSGDQRASGEHYPASQFYAKEADRLSSSQDSEQNKVDNFIFLLSVGSIASSATIVFNLTSSGHALVGYGWLIVSWVLFFLALIGTIFGLGLSIKRLDSVRIELDIWKKDGYKNSYEPTDKFRKWVRWSNYFCYTMVIAGLIVLSVFGARNLGVAQQKAPTAIPEVESETTEVPDEESSATQPTQETAKEPVVVPQIFQQEQECHPSYSGCLDPRASDYDCTGGSGNGPNYTGKVRVLGPDVFGLDRDKDGWGCE